MTTQDDTENATQTYLFSSIAEKYMFVKTLKPRNSDVLDYHDVSVTAVSKALREAFDRGRMSQMGKDSSSVSFAAVNEDRVQRDMDTVVRGTFGWDALSSDRSDGIDFRRVHVHVHDILNSLRLSYQCGIQSVMDATDKMVTKHTGLKP